MGKLLTRAAAMVACALLSAAVWAQPAPRNQEKETAIWNELRRIAPQSLPQFQAATEALDRQDFREAAHGFEAVLQAAPDFEPALRRGGAALALSGRRREGLAHLERAYANGQSHESAISLARTLASTSKPTDRKNLQRALQLARYVLPSAPADDPAYLIFYTDLAYELRDEAAFREGLKWLRARHPDEMKTHYHEAIRAGLDGDEATATRELARARELGLSAKIAADIHSEYFGNRPGLWLMRWFRYALYLIAGWAFGLLMLFALGKFISRLTLRSIEQADPNGKTSPAEASLRIWYRRLIAAAGFYYYLSLPVLALVLIVAVFLGFCLFLLIGRIPIKASVLLIVGLLATLWVMVRSLFVKVESEEPGRVLKPEEAPGLWALTREVAKLVGTRPIDEIRITPGCDLAVYETGSRRERARNQAKRHLILGAGVLNGLRINAFRAILAHEYGHFSNRDTAGGDVALRVNQDMLKFVAALARSGRNLRLSIPFHFVRVYHFIYRRITHGAERLQEVLADRVAVRIFGAASFEEGLRHVIRRGVEFNHAASREIEAALQTRRALANLYQLPAPNNYDEVHQIEEEIQQIINRPTTEDDTHPSPIDRFRLAGRIQSRNLMPPAGMVWDLFADRDALTTEMSRMIDRQVNKS